VALGGPGAVTSCWDFCCIGKAGPTAEGLLLDRPVAHVVATLAPAGRTRRREGGGRSRLSLAGLVSLLLHGAVLAALVILAHRMPKLAEPPPDQVATVELVLDKGPLPGAARPPHPTPEPVTPAPAPPKTEASEAVPPPVVPPAPPAPQAHEAPTISIGGANGDTSTILRAEGPYVTPATLDSKYSNRNPNYPGAAVALAQEGAVVLLIHVSADGLVAGADILESSGYRLLDESAVDAARSWHFLPAVKDGQPVAFDLPFRMVFQLDRH